MRPPRELYHGTPIVYSCELGVCLKCGEPLKVAYVSAVKTVQTLTSVLGIAHRPKRCSEPSCARHEMVYKSAQMFERLIAVKDCLATLITHYPEPQLVLLHQGLHAALQAVQAEYADLRQAAAWLQAIAHILDPDDKPPRTGIEVRQELFTYLDTIPKERQLPPHLEYLYQAILKTTRNYAPGLFHCYDLPGLPRTNNDLESEFRDLNRRLLQTSGQKGLARRTIQRQGAWELIPRPDSLRATVLALSQVNTDNFRQERHRVRTHRQRFRLHTRSPKQSGRQLEQLANRWLALPAQDST